MLPIVRDDTISFSHCCIFIIALDLFIIVKTEEILQLREVLLMSRHEVIYIVDSLCWHISRLAE